MKIEKISLRDQIAIRVMQALIRQGEGFPECPVFIAEMAYKIADEMLYFSSKRSTSK